MDVYEEESALHYPIVSGYRIGEEIGNGGFSKVFRAIDDNTNKVMACKVVNLWISPSLGVGVPNYAELKKEVQVHKAMNHEYILKLMYSETFDLAREAEGIVPGLYMLLELAVGGDLFDKIVPDVGIPEDLAKFYFAQMVSGMSYIHEKGVAHRDIKPENLLLAANGNLKITDFGLCAVFRHKGKTRKLSGRCGSLPYVAPELGGVDGAGYEAEPVDIWGMGVVLYTLLVGNTPWDEPSDASPEFCAYRTGELLQYDPWTRIKGQAKSILLGMLTIDPSHRLTMQGIATHQWTMTPSQLHREQMAEALTQGMRQTGMMAIVDPAFRGAEDQAYAQARTQRMMTESQWASTLTKPESQFMRGTGALTQSGDYIRTSTRFWLNLQLPDASQLIYQYLKQGLGEHDAIRTNQSRTTIHITKIAGNKSMTGSFVLKTSDAVSAEGGTLVVMQRERGSLLHWRAFWWTVVRDQKIEPYVVKGDTPNYDVALGSQAMEIG